MTGGTLSRVGQPWFRAPDAKDRPTALCPAAPHTTWVPVPTAAPPPLMVSSWMNVPEGAPRPAAQVVSGKTPSTRTSIAAHQWQGHAEPRRENWRWVIMVYLLKS
ncbi:MAG: hypothetical protein BWX80_03311 [Candidatus Hydrogenedentes bacterium ADurb.Bin101]|nr:MAG: hypothetical protein BWX80_03311 [Candidatus Hydrogenedentes bacterium ADurb.Bin101]